MKKLVVFIPSLSEKHRAAIAASAEAHGLACLFCDDREAALAQAAEAHILFTQDAALPREAGHLEWLCTPSAGVEPFLPDSAYANPGALLTNSSGAYGTTIAEHIVMVTLELMRRRQEYFDIVARRDWVRSLPMRSIRNSRVTLLGAGDIGREAARRLRAFYPASIIGVNRSGRDPGGDFDRVVAVEDLDRLLPETDLLVISLPGTGETRHLMDGRRLALLPGDAFLVNVGRGSVLDQTALRALMEGGRLAGAALDVFEQEPIPREDPLWHCPRLLITPHVAGDMALPYTVERIVAMFLEDLDNFCAGRPLIRLVDRGRGY